MHGYINVIMHNSYALHVEYERVVCMCVYDTIVTVISYGGQFCIFVFSAIIITKVFTEQTSAYTMASVCKCSHYGTENVTIQNCPACEVTKLPKFNLV